MFHTWTRVPQRCGESCKRKPLKWMKRCSRLKEATQTHHWVRALFFKKKKKKKKKIYKTVVEQLKAVVKSQGFPLKMLIHSYLSKLCIYTAVNGYDMMCFCVCAQFFRSFHCKIRSGIWSRKNQEEEKLVFNPTGQFWVNCCPFNWNI